MKSYKIIYFVTGKKNEDGSIYYPPFMRSQIESVKEEGFIVDVVVLTNNYSITSFIKNVAYWKVQIRNIGCCIIHAQYGSVTALVAALCKGKNPLVISFCGDDVLGTKQKGWFWSFRSRLTIFLSHMSALFADILIAKSKNIYDRLWANEQKICEIIPNGVDMNKFTPISYVEARQNCGWDTNEFIVLFNPSTGNNSYVKNKILADAAFELLKKEVPHSKLVYIKNKSYSEINSMMHGADVLLVTSLHEGSPNIVKEAMACNLPVVTVNCGDVSERLKNVQPSIVVPNYDYNLLALELIKIANLRQRSNGRKALLEQELDNASVIKKIKNIYRRLI